MVKSKEEVEYDELRLQYRKRFNKGYGITIGDPRPLSEHIEILKEALRTGRPVEVPDYGDALEDGIVI